MPEYYDDNFEHWEDMDDPDMQDFYWKTQRTNVKKICRQCEREVWLKPDYDLCGRCATANENGWGM